MLIASDAYSGLRLRHTTLFLNICAKQTQILQLNCYLCMHEFHNMQLTLTCRPLRVETFVQHND